MKPFILSVAIVFASSTALFAQSLPNYGPNAPSNVDSFGQPPSGTMPPGVPRYGYRAYPYHRYAYHHRYWHRRHWHY